MTSLFSVENRIGAAEFYCQAQSCFESALQKITLIRRQIKIKKFRIEFQFAGNTIEECCWPALAHLEVDVEDSADYVIQVWDSYSSQTNMIPMAWSSGDVREVGLVRGFNDEYFETAFVHEPNGLNMLDHSNNQAIFWVSDYREMPAYMKAAPFRILFHWWLRVRGLFLTHGAVIGTGNAAILLAAKGGSGKSTTAISCLDSHLYYLGDDYCLVEHEPVPMVYYLYSSSKLTYESWERWPQLQKFFQGMIPLKEEKIIHFLYPEKHDKLLCNLPLKAIVVPAISQGHSLRFESLSKVQALQATAPSSIFQLPGTGKREFQHFSHLVKKIPSYKLWLSENINAIPGIIHDIIDNAHAYNG